MTTKVLERRLPFETRHLDVIGIPVNTEGIVNAGLALHAKELSETWFHSYKKSCENNQLQTEGYHVYSDANVNFVAIPTRISYKDKPDLDLIIRSLLNFNEEMTGKISQGIGHCIERIYLPALGCGLGELVWDDIEDKLKEVLKDTRVEYIFCIESKRRPNRYSEKIIQTRETRDFYFKGDSVLGIVGSHSVTLPNHLGQEETYTNGLVYILERLIVETWGESDLKEARVIREKQSFKDYLVFMKSRIGLYLEVKGQLLASGASYRDFITELIHNVYHYKRSHSESYRRELKRIYQLGITQVYYCGYEFPRITGINRDLDSVDMSIEFNNASNNEIGKIITNHLNGV